jgi:glycosyltransferase involved in cell wall biosynthesis
MSSVERVGVVVPVHNEEHRLASCLDALGVAAASVPVEVSVIVVLDACTDRSPAITRRFIGRGVDGIALDVRSVGRARAAGMAELLRRHGESGTWLATTDADSTVPPNWLAAQLRYARLGTSVVAGTVAVDDWEDRSADVRIRASRAYDAVPHRHVHGANLSFSASAYLLAGGFPLITCHEDVRLVEAFQRNGENITWATDLAVTTSARRNARAPEGFAGYLSSLEEDRGSVDDDAPSSLPRAM